MTADQVIKRVDIEIYGSRSGQTRELVLRLTVEEESGKDNTAALQIVR
jgi:hypothetical protein